MTSDESRMTMPPITLFLYHQGKSRMNLRSCIALGDAIAQLEREKVRSAGLAAELLLMHTLGRDRAWIYSHPEEELDAKAAINIRCSSGGVRVESRHNTSHRPSGILGSGI